ncbi:MAG TPA: hypothetical protein VI318_07905 [Baekduia sp.]
MTDREIDGLVAAVNPVDARELAGLDVRAGEAALWDGLAAALATPARQARPRTRHRRRLTAALALAVTLAAAVLAFTALSDRGGAGDPGSAWAAPLVRLAESSPLLLLGGDGWTVTRADEYPVRQGELSLEGPGDAQAGLFWRSNTVAQLERDRAFGAAQVVQREVLGHRAQVAQYAGPDGRGIADFTAIWADDDGRTIEVRADGPDLARFEALLRTVRRVDVDAWLSALPPSAVKQADRAAVVDAMLKGIPVPPGFDPTAVQTQELTSDRYQLGAAVAGAVACAWIDRWDAARRAGDGKTVTAAVAAMGTAKDWPILKEMARSGEYPAVVRDFATGMAEPGDWHGRPLKAQAVSALGCRGG